eukprot:snap_masked-scaffold_77-processed-gene-0.24-mRNA-1 protein AED:1.00 eAED:1.00 QI:0/-1/0/0/-1/1/1/0/62
MYLYSQVKVVEGEQHSKTTRIPKGAMQDDSLLSTLHILALDSIMYRLKDNTCEEVSPETDEV